ncbi:helix-turn-helix domain-containing protein [Chryseobacterium sp. WLY505]|uniref:helix-turn-helix domain-containing protein n=1 Tax=Chryseobacterium sp. WLY505 TaxID=3068892 RepID=UPI0027965599|nr:helix-turn-helix transcriptional regulator [Chryseobacterium sp. WLY505]MDQ1859001.1 helix-turn-helix transcriptional regulator [Chryseobacterium sp. WLY505]
MLRIKEVLKEKKMSQIELAEKLDITTVGLNKIINGNPTVDTLLKIADALDEDVRNLLSPSKEEDSEPIYRKDENGNEIIIGYLKK